MEVREAVPGFERYLAAIAEAVPGLRFVDVAKRGGGGPLITLGRQGRDRGEGRCIDLLLVGEERHRRQNGRRHGGSEKRAHEPALPWGSPRPDHAMLSAQ